MSWSSHDGRRGPGARTRWPARRICAALVAGAALLASPAAAAVSYSIATEAGLLAYEDPFLLGGGDRGAILGEIAVSPGVKITGANGTALDISGTATARGYHRRYGEYFLGNARAAGVVRQSDQLTLNAAASFQRDISADTLTTDIDAASEPGSVRNTIAADASLVWRPSGRSTITPRLAFERSTFSDSILLRSTRALTGEVAYDHQLTDRTSLGVGVRGVASRSGDDAKFATLAIFATIDQRLSPLLRLTGEAGAERVRDRSRGTAPGGDGDRTSFTARGQLCREGQSLTACLSGSVSSGISALGFLQREYGAGATASLVIGPRLSAGLVADYTRSEREEGAFGLKQSAVSVRGVLDRRLSASAILSGEIGYRQREIGVGRKAGGGFAGIRLRWER